METCGCSDCIKRNGPAVGQKLYVKPDKILVKGVLPPDLSQINKVGKFEVLKLQNDTKTGRPSAALRMPTGVGNLMTIDGKDVWCWFVYNEDIYGTDEPTVNPKEDQHAPKASAYKAGDVVSTVRLSRMSSGITETENKAGFKVLGVIDRGANLVVEVAPDKGIIKEGYGHSCNIIPTSDATMVSQHKFKVGDIVRAKPDERTAMSPGITNTLHNQGFAILDIKGNDVILELTTPKGYSSPEYPGKSINQLKLNQIELAPPMRIRKGDKVRFKKKQLEYLPSRLSDQQKREKMEVVEVHGDYGYHEYTIKLPDGMTARYGETRLILPSMEGKVSNDENFKVGKKVKVQEDHRDELPDCLSEKARSQSFEILSIDYDGEVCLKMANSCTDAEHNDEFDCRVWYINKDYLEENTKMSKRNSNSGDDVTFVERLAANAEKGAIKTVGRKLANSVKSGVLRAAAAAGKSNGMDETQVGAGIQMFSAFMETPFGTAIISSLLGIALAQGAPHLAGMFPIFEDERIQDLADEMQSEGAAIVMEKAIDIAMEHFLPEIGNILSGLPPKKEEKVRVATETKATTKKKARVVAEEHDEEHEEEAKAGKRNAA